MVRKSITDIRREEIIEAFYATVADVGFGKATIREIAKRAGCSYGVLNYHFANKEEMVLCFMDHVISTFTTELMRGIYECNTATERLEFMFSYFCDLSRFSLEFSRVWLECWSLGNSNPEISQRLNGAYDNLKCMIEEIVAEGIKRGEFRKVDPTIMANLILATCEGTTMLWVVNTQNTPIESLNEHFPDFCMSYLKKEK